MRKKQRQKPGRKPSGDAEVRVDLKFPRALKAACQEAAHEDGVALNEWLREAARRWLADRAFVNERLTAGYALFYDAPKAVLADAAPLLPGCGPT
jgi:hypothetical protein